MSWRIVVVVLGGVAGYMLARWLPGTADKTSFWRDPVVLAVGGAVAAFLLINGGMLFGRVAWADTVAQVATKDELDRVLSEAEGNAVVVDFFATWCMPCKATAPNVNALAKEGVRVAVVDVDKASALAQQYEVSVIPTLLVIRNGEVVRRTQGYHSLAGLRALLQE
jgi:thioredoxin 1